MKKTNKLIAFKNLHGHTWRGLAKKIGITPANLHRIAHGETKDLKISTANKIKKVTGLEPKDYLMK